MGIVVSLLVGVGLSAACGFRVFLPLLVLNIGARTGHLSLSHGFEWMGGNTTLMALSVAAILEVLAYYIPWLDNLLDTVSTPAAVIAGSVATASLVGDLSPFLQWSLAIIAGGGAAAAVQTATVSARAASTVTTAGAGNPLLSTGEWLGSLTTAVLAIVAPLICLILVGGITLVLLRKFMFKPASP